MGGTGALAPPSAADPTAAGCLYRAYGLRICSAFELSGLPAAGRHTDVTIGRGDLRGHLPVDEHGDYWFRVTDGKLIIYSAGVAAGLLEGGTVATVDPVPGVHPALLQSFLLGPVLAFLLHQRGLLVLHASAVEVGRQAVAFLGPPGAGKSSTAAALYARGHAVVADDLVAVHVDEARPVVFPGFPLLRLCRDTWDRYAAREAAWNPSAVDEGKSVWPAARGFRPDRLPLQRLYVLESSDRNAAEPMRPAQAAIALARQTFAGRRDPAAALAHLHQCESLAKSGVVWRLRRGRDLCPDVVAQFVEDDISRAG